MNIICQCIAQVFNPFLIKYGQDSDICIYIGCVSNALTRVPGMGRTVLVCPNLDKPEKIRHESTEVVYGITSCGPEKATAEQMLQWARKYWGIENGLHYRRDVTLHEDATRISQPPLAKTIAAINSFVVALSQKLGFSNLASARRAFDASIAAQLR